MITAPPRASLPRRVAITFCVVLAIVYLAPLAYLAIWQRSIIFVTSQLRIAPADAGLQWAKEVAVKTGDGETLVAWLVPPTKDKPFLIYLHGNADTLQKRAARFKLLTEDGAGLLAIDWRGYGGSTGSPSQEGLQRDALAAYDHALAVGAGPKNIVLVGESLGTGLAIWLAGERQVAGLVLDSPYSAIVDVGAARYWMFPVRLVQRDPFPAIEWITRVHAPIFAAAGAEDRVIPLQFAQKLMDTAPQPKTFVIVPGAGHVVLGRPDVMARTKAFIAEVTR